MENSGGFFGGHFSEFNVLASSFAKRNCWVFVLIIIFLLAFYLRAIPGTKLESPKLQAIDPYFFYRMGEYMIENGNLPENDVLAAWGTIEGGPNRRFDFVVTLWAYPIIYFMLNPMFGVSWYWVAVWSPALFGALQVLLIYFLAKELFNSRKIGLLSATFLAFVPGILYRVSAGFIEKEPIAGALMVLGLYFFVKAFKEKEKGIQRELSWKYILIHPFSLLHKSNMEEERVRTVKTVAYAVTSGIILALMAGAWGGVRIPLMVIGLFTIASVILNRFPKVLLYSHVPMFIAFFLVSRAFIVSPWIKSIDVVVNLVAIAFLLARYLAERLRLVKEDYLPYVGGVFLLLALFLVGTASYVYIEFGEWVGYNIASITNPLTLEVIPSTVAESQVAGDFIRGTLSTFGNEYAVSAFQWPAILVYLSAIYFAALGILLACYEFVFRKRDLEHVFIVVFFVSCMILAMGAQRLSFVFAFPVSISAGYFLIRGGGYMLGFGRRALKEKGYAYLKITGGIVIGIVIFTNFASGWLMANGIGSSLSDDWYEALVWIRENTPEDSVILEWWDFGWWFHEIAERRTLVDGGYHNRVPTQDIAKFFTEPLSDDPSPYSSLSFLKNYTVDYVMVSPDLIQKFGAMSKIANWGAKIDVLPLFTMVNSYQEGNKVLLEYSGSGQTILVAYSFSGNENETTWENITALIKTPQGQVFVRNVGIGNQVITNPRESAVPGMVYFAGDAVLFLPEAVQDCVFVRLYLFDGAGMEKYFEKVYDAMGMKIYEVNYENFPEGIDGLYINAENR